MENKLKVMFDCNSFDKLIKLDNETLDKLFKHVEPYCSNVQYNELQKMVNKKPKKLNEIEKLIKQYEIPCHSGYFGFSGSECMGFGQGNFQSEESRNHQKKLIHNNNYADTHLATLAKDYGCIVITNDGVGTNKGLYKILKAINQPVLSFEELIHNLNIPN